MRRLHITPVEWRASRIDDPIEKLAFLRREMCEAPARRSRVARRLGLVAGVFLSAGLLVPTPAVVSDVSRVPLKDPFPGRSTPFAGAAGAVWIVDRNEEFEMYSNGLRVENGFERANVQRFYQAFNRAESWKPTEDWRSEPVGIVYHTTESNMAPFEAAQNHALIRFGQGLLHSIRERRSYNFVIDRFGRVWRIVPETDAANHSGNSVWADARHAYLNLNSSFLGVAFEAQTSANDISPAQVHAGRVLTEMLRSKFHIPARNCVTHAQVSVNPSNGLVGYHTDWAGDFPFAGIGLPQNYDLPVPAIGDFGFTYDAQFRAALGEQVWNGITAAERSIELEAHSKRTSLDRHRRERLAEYRRLYASLRADSGRSEN